MSTPRRLLNGVDPLGLYWQYSQSTGTITHFNDATGQQDYSSSGYSGNGAGYNNPAMQNVPDTGPLPQGHYSIGPEQNNVTHTGHTLTNSMRLTPLPGNNMFGRGGFLIHGRGLSNGCIATDQGTRDQIGNSGDTDLHVVQ